MQHAFIVLCTFPRKIWEGPNLSTLANPKALHKQEVKALENLQNAPWNIESISKHAQSLLANARELLV